jgi:hypothetical protein
MLKTRWYCFLALCMSVGPAFAQNMLTGTLVGTVTDSSGSVVAAANVTVTNTQTRIVTRTVTNAAGAYYALRCLSRSITRAPR